MGGLGANLEQRHDLVLAAVLQLGGNPVDRGARGIRFDIHHRRRQAGRFCDRDPVFTFSLRDAASITSISSGQFGAGPIASKSRLPPSSAKGMYLPASDLTC